MKFSADESAALAYEFRRHLAAVQANAELLLEESFGSVTPEQREALKEIVGNTSDVTTLAAHAFETGDPETVIAMNELTDSEPSPTLTDPDALPQIVVGLDGKFGEFVVEQLERAGYDSRVADPDTLFEEAPTGTHCVLDCGIPTATTLDALAAFAETVDSLALISTVRSDSVPAPFLGASGVLSPTASARTIGAVLAEELPAPGSPPLGRIGYVGDDAPLPARLEDRGFAVVRRSPTDGLASIAAADVDCLFVEATAVDHLEETALAAFRTPTNSVQLPIVVVGVPPSESDEAWLPTVGHRLFARKPMASVDLAAELSHTVPGVEQS